MNRKQLVLLFARITRRSPGRAADIVDSLVYRMLKEIKRPFSPVPNSDRSSAAGSSDAEQETQ